MSSEEQRIVAESLTRSREAINLAEQGLYRCRFCKQVRPLPDGIIVTWGGSVIFALCPACCPERSIVIKQSRMQSTGQRSVHVGFGANGQKNDGLLVVDGMDRIADHVPKAALASYKKFDLSDEDS